MSKKLHALIEKRETSLSNHVRIPEAYTEKGRKGIKPTTETARACIVMARDMLLLLFTAELCGASKKLRPRCGNPMGRERERDSFAIYRGILLSILNSGPMIGVQ